MKNILFIILLCVVSTCFAVESNWTAELPLNASTTFSLCEHSPAFEIKCKQTVINVTWSNINGYEITVTTPRSYFVFNDNAGNYEAWVGENSAVATDVFFQFFAVVKEVISSWNQEDLLVATNQILLHKEAIIKSVKALPDSGFIVLDDAPVKNEKSVADDVIAETPEPETKDDKGEAPNADPEIVDDANGDGGATDEVVEAGNKGPVLEPILEELTDEGYKNWHASSSNDPILEEVSEPADTNDSDASATQQKEENNSVSEPFEVGVGPDSPLQLIEETTINTAAEEEKAAPLLKTFSDDTLIQCWISTECEETLIHFSIMIPANGLKLVKKETRGTETYLLLSGMFGDLKALLSDMRELSR